MQFPISEPEINALAEEMKAGLIANTAIYPSPPVSTADLQAAIDVYEAAKNLTVENKARYGESVRAKDEALATLKNHMKTDLRYAENTVNFNDGKLMLLGWSGRRARHSLKVPGQPRSLEAPRQGEGWLYLDWKKPADSGKVTVYKIQRRTASGGGDKMQPASDNWVDIATAMETEITLKDQPRGVEFEYRIVAINKAGTSYPSNTEMAVL